MIDSREVSEVVLAAIGEALVQPIKEASEEVFSVLHEEEKHVTRSPFMKTILYFKVT